MIQFMNSRDPVSGLRCLEEQGGRGWTGADGKSHTKVKRCSLV